MKSILKPVLLVSLATCVLTSCSIHQCPTYAGIEHNYSKHTNTHYSAKHVKPRKSLVM